MTIASSKQRACERLVLAVQQFARADRDNKRAVVAVAAAQSAQADAYRDKATAEAEVGKLVRALGFAEETTFATCGYQVRVTARGAWITALPDPVEDVINAASGLRFDDLVASEAA